MSSFSSSSTCDLKRRNVLQCDRCHSRIFVWAPSILFVTSSHILLGIERNLKVWTTDRRCLLTRRHACMITLIIVLLVVIYNHPFLFWPYDASYCVFELFHRPILFACDNAHYKAYGRSFSLTNLLFIENVGLNNFILPILIISTNIVLIYGLRRRAYQRRHRLGTSKTDDWRERSVVLYMLLSSIAFIILTSPVGILGAWAVMRGHRIPMNNLALILDLMEIVHHCSHFPLLLMTSSIIRTKTFQILFQPTLKRHNSFNSRYSMRPRLLSQSSAQHDLSHQRTRLGRTTFSSLSWS